MGRLEVFRDILAHRDAAVFLDRDNTIIKNDGDLGDPEKVKLIQGAASAIASFRGLGYKIVVVTNQGGVARGKYSEQDVQAVHERIQAMVKADTGAKIDRFFFCPYHPEGTVQRYRREHPWRKPQPGMLHEAARLLNVDLGRSWMIGDQVRDVQAGASAGTRTILLAPDAATAVAMQQAAEAEAGAPVPEPQFIARDLAEAARIIAHQRRPELSAATDTEKPPPEAPPAAPAPTREAPPHPPRAVSQPPKAASAPASPQGIGTQKHAEPSPTPPAEEAAAADDSRPTIATPPADHTLRQILAELRNQRDDGDDFSLFHVTAIFLQAVAALCLLGGLWMGAGNEASFVRWILLGLLFELATIAVLLFRRR